MLEICPISVRPQSVEMTQNWFETAVPSTFFKDSDRDCSLRPFSWFIWVYMLNLLGFLAPTTLKICAGEWPKEGRKEEEGRNEKKGRMESKEKNTSFDQKNKGQNSKLAKKRKRETEKITRNEGKKNKNVFSIFFFCFSSPPSLFSLCLSLSLSLLVLLVFLLIEGGAETRKFWFPVVGGFGETKNNLGNTENAEGKEENKTKIVVACGPRRSALC